jgi:hypothetical protein
LKGLDGDFKGCEGVDGLRGEDRFNKCHPPGVVEISSMERREARRRFIIETTHSVELVDRVIETSIPTHLVKLLLIVLLLILLGEPYIYARVKV